MPFVRVALDRRDAICGIRHVFLEEDVDGPGLLASLTTRPDLPPPSYVLHSSPGRVHVFWRVRGFDAGTVETMQKRLARELRSDTAATSCAQTTRLPGFANYKRLTPSPVTIEYLRPSAVFGTDDFPRTRSTFQTTRRAASFKRSASRRSCGSRRALSVGCRACRCRTARRPAHISNLLSRGSRIRAFRSRGNVRSLRVERTVSAALVRTGVADESSERQEVRPGAPRCARPATNERDSCVSSYRR